MHIVPEKRLEFLATVIGTRFFEIVPNIQAQTTLSPYQLECLYIEGCAIAFLLYGEGEPFNRSRKGLQLLGIQKKRLRTEGVSSFHFLTNIFSVCSHSFDTVEA